MNAAPHLQKPLPGEQAIRWKTRDQAVTSPSNTRDYPLVVKRAFGAVIEDVDGNTFLDFASGIAVCSTGHCHPQVVAAIQKQASELIHICGSDFYYPVFVELAEKLAAIAPWKNQTGTRVYFGNSGTEAIEAAIKLARYHTKRKWIIAFEGAFHGRTMGALALTCSKYRQKLHMGPLIPMVAHVPYGDIGAIHDRLFKRHFEPSEVAAIFVEPVQGEGGYHFAPPGFLKGLRELCDQHGILLVADEVQSGIGRTGKWWACEHDGVAPDILCSAKGLGSGMPISAMLARSQIMDWPPGAQGSTFGGNPICCAAALATLEVIEKEYLANTATQGAILLDKLKTLAQKVPIVANPRGRGLMAAIDVVKLDRASSSEKSTALYAPELRNKIVSRAFESGLILLPCGESAIRVIPPLCISRQELDNGIQILEQVLGEAQQ